MADSNRKRLRELGSAFDAVPTPIDRKDYRVKVFKSGNSVALRLPAELGLQPGSEMRLQVENGEIVGIAPLDLPKRKFNIGKVCGSATNLQPIRDEDRIFEERALLWPTRASRDPA